MDNLKIRVNSEAESKEAQELFFELGCEWYCHGDVVNYTDKPFLYVYEDYLQFGSNVENFHSKNSKEITLPQLKDIVVLKKNCANDATHIRVDGKKYFYAKSTDYFYQFSNDSEWLLSTWMNHQLLPQLKPIAEQMKEYLDPNNNYSYHNAMPILQDSNWIEIPDGAEVALINTLKLSFFKNNGKTAFFDFYGVWRDCAEYGVADLDHYLQSNLAKEQDAKIVWQRDPTKHNETPSSEDCKNVNPARKHSHYFKDVSHLNEIDVYDILKLFEVTDPCLQHIVKKALCAGGRGHKDLQEDLQDIVDTAIRAVELNK